MKNSAGRPHGPMSTYSDQANTPGSVPSRAGEPAIWWAAMLPCAIGIVLGLVGGGVHFWSGNRHAAAWALNSAWWAFATAVAVQYGARGRA